MAGTEREREREVLTRAETKTSILQLASSRELKQLSLLNTRALELCTTIMCLLHDITQAFWFAIFYTLHCTAAIFRGCVRFPCSIAQATHHLLEGTATLLRQTIPINSPKN